MRHKYETAGIVLSRAPLGEANALVTILTPELGVVRARAQGVRRSGAKLAPALATLSESSLVLVRGNEGWRVAGAVLGERWLSRIQNVRARAVAARVSGLVVRLVAGEMSDPELFPIMKGFFEALATLPEEEHEAVEILAAMRILRALGLDAGAIPGAAAEYSQPVLGDVAVSRSTYVARINQGLTASGL